MAYETLLFAREESFAIITLNRPPANAISEPLMRELNAALNSVAGDDTVRAVIITGAGDRIFCAGADLGSAFSGGDVDTFIRFGNSVVRKIERFTKPVIAAINGHALGGGCEIAMACHFRLLKETARMGQTESNLGIIPGYGGTQRLPRLIGRTKALEFLILGTQISAPECLALGLVNRLCKEGETLADEGCRVAIVDLNAEGAEETAREIEAAGGRARGYACDIRDTGQVQEAVARIERDLGAVDILVNNAGMIYTVGQLKDMRDEDWELNLGVNLTGAYKMTKAVFPGMRERRWGRIVCMASIAGLMGGFGQTAYATTKIGVIGFAKSVALEGARYNVTCNAIAPGIIAPNAKLSPLYDRMVKRVAMQREGEPEDVASAVLFLCSERARYITGAVLTVTGGMDLFTF